MKINGKELKVEHNVALEKATEMFNRFRKHRDPEHVDVTPQEYLEDLMNRQLEGLAEGVALEESIEEVQQKKLDEARRRVGL